MLITMSCLAQALLLISRHELQLRGRRNAKLLCLYVKMLKTAGCEPFALRSVSSKEHFGLQFFSDTLHTDSWNAGRFITRTGHLKPLTPDIWHLKNKCVLHIVYCVLNVHITYRVILEQPLRIIRSDCSRMHCLHGTDNTHSRSTHQVSQHKWHECMRKLLFCQGFWISHVSSWLLLLLECAAWAQVDPLRTWVCARSVCNMQWRAMACSGFQVSMEFTTTHCISM